MSSLPSWLQGPRIARQSQAYTQRINAGTRRRAHTVVTPATVRAITRKTVAKMSEHKYHDTEHSAEEASFDDPYIYCLNVIAQGDNDQQRDGDKLQMSSLQIRGSITYPSAAAIGRLIIVNMKSGNVDASGTGTTVFGLSDILQGTPSALSIFENYHHDKRSRFQVLYDRTFCLPQSGTSTANVPLSFKKSIKLKKTVQFLSGGTSCTKNAVYMIWLSSSTDVSNNGPTLDAIARINFVDL